MPSRPSSSSRPRAGLALAFAIAGVAACGAWLHPAARTITSDFANYYVPARVVVEGGTLARIYERTAFDEAARAQGFHALGSFIPHPPANALLLLPLARLSPARAKGAWTALLVLTYGASLVMLRRTSRLGLRGLVVIGVMPGFALVKALAYGQPYPLLLLLICASLAAAQRGSWRLAGALLAPAALLKLYALPFVALWAWQRRGRALLGFGAAAIVMTAASWVVLGGDVHRAYAREVLPASLDGRIQDPYSIVWQSASSLSRRLFEREPDLNPQPAWDRPSVARFLARAIPAGLTAWSVLVAAAASVPAQQWGILVCGALAASPLAASYHFVLLVLPVAVLAGDRGRSRRAAAAMIGLAVFAASPLPHHFGGWAHGAASPLAYPRLFAALGLLAVAAGPSAKRWHLAAAAAVALASGLSAAAPGRVPAWRRLAEGGYLQAAPIACGGAVAWLGIEDGAYVIRATDGTRLPVVVPPQVPVCRRGRVVAEPASVTRQDSRFGAPARAARLSPDGAWWVAPVWRGRSWDIEILSAQDGRVVTVTDDPANELEPSWSEDGRSILFASDRGRGLGSTAIYEVALGVRERPASSATASRR